MTTEALRDQYDRQLRTQAEVGDADEIHRIGPLWLGTYPSRRRGFVTYENIPTDQHVDGLIDQALDHFMSDDRIDEFEWKTRAHDQIPHLIESLIARGFELEDPETVMVGPIEAALDADPGLPAGYRLERASTPDQIRDGEELAGRVFGHDEQRVTRTTTQLVQRLEEHPESFEMWLVRAGDDVVCSGRIDFVDGTEFASLWGGACDADHRGRGLYRAITAERARSAVRMGKKYLQSDCTSYSQPILERAGLVAVTTSTPATWTRPST